jgi:hypothetical protein
MHPSNSNKLQLNKLEAALGIAKQAAQEQKWKQLSDLAIAAGKVIQWAQQLLVVVY